MCYLLFFLTFYLLNSTKKNELTLDLLLFFIFIYYYLLELKYHFSCINNISRIYFIYSIDFFFLYSCARHVLFVSLLNTKFILIVENLIIFTKFTIKKGINISLIVHVIFLLHFWVFFQNWNIQ